MPENAPQFVDTAMFEEVRREAVLERHRGNGGVAWHVLPAYANRWRNSTTDARDVNHGGIAWQPVSQRRVAEAVHNLEEPYRTTVVLRYLEEKSATDIAREQGVPLKTVQTRLQRGLERLRGRLDSEYGGNRKAWVVLLLPLALPSQASAAGGGAVAAATWIALMKPKVLLSILLVLVLGSTALVREMWGSDERAPSRYSPSEDDRVATRNIAAPTESEKPESKPAAVQPGTMLLRGILRNRDGILIEDAQVTPGAWGKDKLWHEIGATVPSDALGAFAVAVQEDARIGVFISHPDYVHRRAWMEPAPAEPAVVTLIAGVRIAVTVLSPDLEPVADARVKITHYAPAGFGIVSAASAPATTDQSGRIASRRVPKGRVSVLVEHENFAERVVSFDVDSDSEQTIVLKNGGSITGLVLDRRGEPVVGAEVRRDDDDDDAAPVVTDESGRYRLDGLSPGWIELVASAKGYGAANFGTAQGWHESTPVPVRDGRTIRGIDLILRDATWLSGRVIDEDGEPLVGFPVEAYTDREVATVTDAKGRFRMALGVDRTGTAVLTFRSRDRWQLDAIADIEVREGESRDLGVLRVVTTAVLSGRVVDEQGEPVAKGRVVTSSNVTSIRAGRFSMRVRPGPQKLRVTAESDAGPLATTAHVNAAPGETVDDLTLTVKRAALIRGKLVSPDGRPSDWRWVMALRVGESLPVDRKLPATAIASKDGLFTLVVPNDGEYRVGLRGEVGQSDLVHFADEPAPITVKPGGPPITLVVPRLNATVTGQVLSGVTRQPLQQYEARLIQYRDGLPWRYSVIAIDNAGGRFQFDDAKGDKEYAIEVVAAEHGIYRSDVFSARRGERHMLPTITLPEQARVRGRVVDGAGWPVPFVRIAVLGPKLERSLTQPVTDSDGRFAPIRVAPGEWTLIAFIPSRAISVVPVRISASRAADVDVTLPPAAPLLVVVTDAQGRPRANVPVKFAADAIAPFTSEHLFRFHLHGHPGQSYRTDSRGELRIGFLPAGPAQVTIGGEHRDTNLVAGAETRVEFEVE